MRVFRESRLLTSFLLLMLGLSAAAQSASYYQQAAALYDQAAAKCSEPGASCMRKYAAYNRCLAAQYGSGGSCGTSPTCSTACSNSASSGGSGSGGGSANNKNAQINQLAESVGDLLSQWAAAREAKHEREAQELQQKAEQEAAQMEAESNAEDQRARERAAFLADPSGASVPTAPNDPEDEAAKLRTQLYAQGQAQSAGSGDSSQPGSGSPIQMAALDPSDQMAQVQAQMTAQAAQDSNDEASIQQDLTNSLKTVQMEGYGSIPAPPAEIDFPTTSAEAGQMGTPQVADNNTGWVESTNPAELQAYRDAPPIQVITFNPDGTSDVKSYPQTPFAQETWPLQDRASSSPQPSPSPSGSTPVQNEPQLPTPAPTPIRSSSYYLSPLPPISSPSSSDPAPSPAAASDGCGAWMNCVSAMYSNAKQQAKDYLNGLWTNATNSFFTGNLCSVDGSCGEKK